MAEQFDLPVEYKDNQYLFKATLNVYGYTHKIQVDVYGQMIVFEPDEERNYRAVLDYSETEKSKNIDGQLLKQIAEAIEELVR